MTVLIVAAVLLGLFMFIQIRVGVTLEYIAQSLTVKLRIGAFWIPLYPGRKEGTDKAKSRKQTPAKKESSKSKSRFLPFAPCVFRAVKRVLCLLRVDRLDMSVQVGGRDPGDTALLYGRLNAAVASFWGPFRSFVNVKSADVHLGVDFDAEKTRAQGSVSVSWRLSQLLSTVLLFACDALVVACRNRTTTKQEGLVT